MSIVFAIWIISIPILIIASTVNVFAGSSSLYRWGFNRYQIADKTGITDLQLTKVGEAMAGYLVGGVNSPQVLVDLKGQKRLLYSEKEIVHLKDVREIVWLFQLLQIISVVLFIASGLVLYLKKGPATLLSGAKIGAVVIISITGLLIAWSLIDFDSLFILFHLISFSNDLWILDPSRDYLIMMFPQGFFNDAAILMVISILVAATLLLTISTLVGKLLRGTGKTTRK